MAARSPKIDYKANYIRRLQDVNQMAIERQSEGKWYKGSKCIRHENKEACKADKACHVIKKTGKCATRSYMTNPVYTDRPRLSEYFSADRNTLVPMSPRERKDLKPNTVSARKEIAGEDMKEWDHLANALAGLVLTNHLEQLADREEIPVDPKLLPIHAARLRMMIAERRQSQGASSPRTERKQAVSPVPRARPIGSPPRSERKTPALSPAAERRAAQNSAQLQQVRTMVRDLEGDEDEEGEGQAPVLRRSTRLQGRA